jgi:signal transduction histidine kinase/ActR/RegA family two-component response regulator
MRDAGYFCIAASADLQGGSACLLARLLLRGGGHRRDRTMTAQQRIVRTRRTYNQWVANQTLEDYALRFTAKSARRWSSMSVANTAIGAISFLALEAIGGSITVNYGFTNAVSAILAVGVVIFFTGLPIAFYASKYGVDIDLLTRGAGFGYIGSTITSLIYASFTFIFFAIEAAIMSLALEMWLGIPLSAGYVVSSLVVIPLVTHGITFISRLQAWTQPIWLILHLLPFMFIAIMDPQAVGAWTHFAGFSDEQSGGFSIVLFGTASMVVFSLIAQIGEQVDFLRFLPTEPKGNRKGWWIANLLAGPGWIIPGMLKMLAGSLLSFLAIQHLVPAERAAEPTQMYLVAFQYVVSSPSVALLLTAAFVIVSQIKINVTNAYAGSIAWSNFFSRLTHSHPGRVVWLVFNVAIALLLMELGIFKALEHILGLYSIIAVAWVGALVSDLIVNKPLGLSPPFIEFKRAHLYDINPVGVGSMVLGACGGIAAVYDVFGSSIQPLAAFFALAISFIAAPAIAFATKGRYYIAREPQRDWGGATAIRCVICEHTFETEDMARCPAYSGPICSLCCSLEARCGDLCKPQATLSNQVYGVLERRLPRWLLRPLNTDIGHYIGVLALFAGVIALVLLFVYFQVSLNASVNQTVLKSTLWTIFFILTIIAGIASWLFVLAHDSRRAAESESRRQTELLMTEIDAHKRTDAKLQKAKEIAEAASKAKSRRVVGLSHELRTPLNAILGYARILERDPEMPTRRQDAIKVVRRSAEHLSGLIDGLLDISKIEAGRFKLNRDEVVISEFLSQVVDMFRLQADAKSIGFTFLTAPNLPNVVSTDENRLRQILINLLSNAIKFTDTGSVTLRLTYRNQVARFEVTDTGIGIDGDDLERIFQPFERARSSYTREPSGTGLGLTITKLLAETMGGDITVKSRVGHGSTFAVKLLLSEVSRPRIAAAKEERIRGYVGQRRRIFVVDDNTTQRELIWELLAPLGFDVVMVASGSECLKLAAIMKPDLVLLDISMPGMDGWEVAKELRRGEPERLAIIMLSAMAMEESASTPERLHDDYIMKPLDFRQLLEKIHAVLGTEWTYMLPEPVGSTLPSAVRALSPGGSVPDPDDIDELLRLGKIGHLRGVQDKLAEIRMRAPQHDAFISHLHILIDAVELNTYIHVLEAARNDHVQG